MDRCCTLSLHQLLTEMLARCKEYSHHMTGRAGIISQMCMSVRLVGRGGGDDDFMCGISDKFDISNVDAFLPCVI